MMKKFNIIFFFFCIIGWAGTSIAVEQSTDFNNYRFNPFQFPYPEYEYTAKHISIDQINQTENEAKRIDCFGVSMLFPKEIADHVEQKSESRMVIGSKKKAIVINFEKEKLMGCSDVTSKNSNKDFCSAFSSTEDFYSKLFSLTPKDLSRDQFSSTGYKWIVHRKGQMFSQVSELIIYKGKNYSIYRTDIKDDNLSIKTELFIFPDTITPNYLILSMNFKDDKIIKTIVSSIN